MLEITERDLEAIVCLSLNWRRQFLAEVARLVGEINDEQAPKIDQINLVSEEKPRFGEAGSVMAGNRGLASSAGRTS
jgi:hypothetical protein